MNENEVEGTENATELENVNVDVNTETPESGVPGIETPSAYEPNYKFKVLDKEHEIDEFLRGAIKSKEEEEKIRDIYTKAFGLDSVKEKYQSVQESIENDYTPIIEDYNQLAELERNVAGAIQNNNLGSACDLLGISEQQILQYAKEILDYREMDPQQRAFIEQQKQLAKENEQVKYQSQGFQSQYEELSVQNRQLEMNLELLKPDVSSFKEQFNAKAGPQAFEQAVIMMGQQVATMYNKDLTAQEAISLVIDQYKWAIGGEENAIQSTQQAPAPVAGVQSTKKPTIPNVGSGGTKSPVKHAINSLDDLRKRRAMLEEQNL